VAASNGIAGKIALGLLIAAGVGEAMASVFDINHPLHNLAGMISVLGLPIAAMLIGVRLGRTQAWSAAKNVLLWTTNLTWVSLVLMVAALIVMIGEYTRTGNKMTPDVVASVGWANRLLVVVYCVWVVTVARQALQLRRRPSRQVRTAALHPNRGRGHLRQSSPTPRCRRNRSKAAVAGTQAKLVS
jgi:Zn-dependent protease with chaperone function